MPEWIIEWGVPAALLTAGIGIVRALLNRAVSTIDRSLEEIKNGLKETKRELRDEFDGKVRGLHHRITELKNDMDKSEKEQLGHIERLQTRISDVQAETARDFVRNQVLDNILTDVRQQFRAIDDKLTELLRRG